MTTVLAIAAAVLAVVALVLVGLLLRRLQDDADDLRQAATQPSRGVRAVTAAAEPTTPAKADVENLRTGSEDLDAALERALEAARTAVGAAAALVVLDTPSGTPVVATLGLGRSEAEHLADSLPPVTANARSVTLTFPLPPAPDEPVEPVRGGLAVPVRAAERRLGLLTVLARAEGRGFGDRDVAALEQVAEESGAAMARALDLRTAPGDPTRDAATGFLRGAGFPAALERAVAEARLRGGALSLALLELDMLRELAADEAVDAVMADAATRLRRVLREQDVACRPGPTTIAVLLPATGADEAGAVASQFQAAVASRLVGGASSARPTAAATTLAADDTPQTLLERAQRELGEQR